jgi:general secretion pathway protein G
MVVVIIIGILVAMVAPQVMGRIDQAQATRVQSDLRAVEGALKFYKLDNFVYPSSEQGLEALVTRPNDPNIRNWNSSGYLARMPKDPWQRPYLYVSPGQNGEIDVYTLGADGQPGGEGTNKDIGNWELE